MAQDLRAAKLAKAQEYVGSHNIRGLFESMMTGLMIKTPEDPLAYLAECIELARGLDKGAGVPEYSWRLFFPVKGAKGAAPAPKPADSLGGYAKLPEIGSEPAGTGDDMDEAITYLQAALRGTLARTKYKAKIAAVVTIQSRARGWLIRKRMKARKLAALEDAWTQPYTITEADPALAAANIVFVGGGPGSGKGTQCDRLIEHLGFQHVSVGDVLRAEVTSGSPAGAKLDEIMKEGKIVPAKVTLFLLQKHFQQTGIDKPYLVDGFPRKVDQSIAFEESICKGKALLWFTCPDEVLTARLLERAKTSGRADDTLETIKKRLETFHTTSEPVLEMFKGDGRAVIIDANRGVDEVWAETKAKVEGLSTSPPADAPAADAAPQGELVE